MEGIRHALISTGPAYLISLVFYFVYGLRYAGGSVGGEVYEDILLTVSAEFWLSPVLLLPVLVVVVLLSFVRRIAKTSRSMSLGVLILHAVFFTITGAYYVSYPVVGGMVKDLYPEYKLDRKNLMRTMLDTGTGLAPMVPWSTTGSYTATTLGVSNLAFLPYAPMLWLSIVFSVIYAVTGIGTAKAKED